MAAQIFPFGTALTVVWHLTKPDGTPFSLNGYSYHVYYKTGNKEIEANSSHLTASGNTLSIVIPAAEPVAPGEYAMRLVLRQNGNLFCTLNYNAAFVLSRQLAADPATQNQEQAGSVVHLYTVAEFYLLAPVVPTVGDDGYWYVNGAKITDGNGEFIPSSHTVEYDPETNYIIIDRGRVDSEGQSIEQDITLLATVAENEETRQENEAVRIATEKRMEDVLNSIVVNFLADSDLYDQAVAQGFVGTRDEWLQSTLGVKGVGIATWVIEQSGEDSGTTTHTITLNDRDKPDGPTVKVFTVKNGKGIVSVATIEPYSGEDSAVNSYRVTYSDDSEPFEFSVKNGKGIASVAVVGVYSDAPSAVNTYRITFSEGDETTGHFDFQVKNANGVASVTQPVVATTNGGVNTIRVNMTNGDHYDFVVRNGKCSAGFFNTAAALNTAVPSPNVGDYAFVSKAEDNSFPAYIYVCTTAGTWTATEAEWDGDNVDLTNYATKDYVSVSQNTLTIGGVDKGELAGQLIENPEWVKVVTDSEDKILYGVKNDGKFYFGDGCPPQVQEYVSAQLGSFNIEDYDDIKTFLGNLIDGDTLATLLNAKVDEVIGKSLIDAEFATSQEVVTDPVYLQVTTDSEDKILEGIKTDGTKVIELPLELQGVRQETIDNPEYIHVITDCDNRVCGGIKKDGDFVIPKCTRIENIEKDVDTLFIENKKIGNFTNIQNLPDYYVNDGYLNYKINIISSYLRPAIINGDAFYFVTDTHWEFNQKHSPAIIHYINKSLQIQKLLHGGDMYQDARLNGNLDVDCINAFRTGIGNNHVYLTDGNHEYIFGGANWGDTFAETRMFLEDVHFGGENKNYFYFDNKQKNIRYINIAAYGPYRNGSYWDGFNNQEQLDWLENVALDTEDGCKVIVFTHDLMHYNIVSGEVVWEIKGSLPNITNILDAYEASGKGQILCIIAGHAHRDHIDYSECNYPLILCTCDNNGNFSYNNGSYQWRDFDDIDNPRYAGTIQEQAIDTVIYNKDNNILHFVRVGVEADNDLKGVDLHTQVACRSLLCSKLTVGNSVALDSYIGSPSWETSDANIATVSPEGIVLAVSVGSVRITATNYSEKQSFYIKITD